MKEILNKLRKKSSKNVDPLASVRITDEEREKENEEKNSKEHVKQSASKVGGGDLEVIDDTKEKNDSKSLLDSLADEKPIIGKSEVAKNNTKALVSDVGYTLISNKNKIFKFILVACFVIVGVFSMYEVVRIKGRRNSITYVEMPDLTNVSLEKAEPELNKLGLKVMKVEQYDKFTKNGYIIKSNIDYGAPVKKGERILLYVSNNNEKSLEVITRNIIYGKTPRQFSGVQLDHISNNQEQINVLMRNITDKNIESITYVIAYYDGDNNILSREDIIKTGLNLKPGEILHDVQNIAQGGAKKISVENIKINK